jgi:hypothetical protein
MRLGSTCQMVVLPDGRPVDGNKWGAPGIGKSAQQSGERGNCIHT